jgi:3-methylfumaryl-CoA hydratase
MSDTLASPATDSPLDLRAWIGRTTEASDVIAPTPASALAATLDHAERAWLAGDALPPLWHWLYFLPLHRQSELGDDGHARRGGFLPPVPLPRRMWAGSRLEFHEPLAVGESVLRSSRILDVTEKSGRSGALVFVKVRHEVAHETARGSRLALAEEHDIVYRDPPRADEPPAKPQPAPAAAFERSIVPDPVLLFRYSALTFNGHRIHYDRSYCTAQEGYPGLVVHGPLQATLLMDLLLRERPQAQVRRFSFRAVRPVFDIAPFSVCGRIADDGRHAQLWARDADGWLTMDAQAEFD